MQNEVKLHDGYFADNAVRVNRTYRPGFRNQTPIRIRPTDVTLNDGAPAPVGLREFPSP